MMTMNPFSQNRTLSMQEKVSFLERVPSFSQLKGFRFCDKGFRFCDKGFHFVSERVPFLEEGSVALRKGSIL